MIVSYEIKMEFLPANDSKIAVDIQSKPIVTFIFTI